jgi:hypothetical protein
VKTELGRKQAVALLTLQRIVSRTGWPSSIDDRQRHRGGTHDKLRDDFHAAVKDLPPNQVGQYTKFEDFCWFFAANDVVVADVPAPKGNRFIVKYSKANALSSRSMNKSEWHYITRKDGTYVGEDELRAITNGGHVQIQSGTALPYAHLYARGLNKARVRDLYTAGRSGKHRQAHSARPPSLRRCPQS